MIAERDACSLRRILTSYSLKSNFVVNSCLKSSTSLTQPSNLFIFGDRYLFIPMRRAIFFAGPLESLSWLVAADADLSRIKDPITASRIEDLGFSETNEKNLLYISMFERIRVRIALIESVERQHLHWTGSQQSSE